MRVLIADDNAVVRLGLVALLDEVEEVSAVIEACDGIETLERIADSAPDIVLLDVRMPRLDGLGVLEELDGALPVLILTHSEESDIVRLAMDRGARGYLVHGQSTPAEIASALTTCLRGGIVLSATAAEAMRREGPPVPGPHPLEAVLTPGEFAVLTAAARGERNEEIAHTQFLSTRTVKNYLNSAYTKIGVHTRHDAIAAWHAGAARSGPDRRG